MKINNVTLVFSVDDGEEIAQKQTMRPFFFLFLCTIYFILIYSPFLSQLFSLRTLTQIPLHTFTQAAGALEYTDFIDEER